MPSFVMSKWERARIAAGVFQGRALRIFRRDQKPRQLRLQAWPDNVRRVLRFLQQFRWNDHVGIDGPQRHFSFFAAIRRQAQARASDFHRR